MNKRVHVYIHGDVTGVGFRFWTVGNAQKLELTGWVRNADQGLVEAEFEGPEKKVKEMIEKCRKGPEVGWVEKVKVEWEEATNEFNSFEVIY